jgi:spermidine synthase
MDNIRNSRTITKETGALIVSVFIAGFCAIIYELLIGTTSSYFLGDSVKQFSLTIGIYMASMGVGSFFSRMISDHLLLEKFIAIEILLGLLGGISVPALYFAFAYTNSYQAVMIVFTIAIGVLIGLEIPFLARIMEQFYTLKVNLSNILSIDYFGALIATLIFPFFLLPFVGTFRSSLVFGLINMLIGFLILFTFAEKINISRKKILWGWNISIFLLILVLLFLSGSLLETWTNNLYQDRVILSKESKYQNIVLTKNKKDIRLYLNGNLQFSSIDEYRYHEPLVHIPLSFSKQGIVLILGGGDGIAVREVLKYPGIKKIVLVDLDPAITDIATKNQHILAINENSLKHPKVSIHNQDAYTFLLKNRSAFNVIISDLPDPSNTSLTRLYSREFYKLIRLNLSHDGIFVTQATSPFYAKKAFWCIKNTVASAGFQSVIPYHVSVPAFGEWGFVLASDRKLILDEIKIQVPTKYLENQTLKKLFFFEKDLRETEVSISSLDKPLILTHYLSGWKYWY